LKKTQIIAPAFIGNKYFRDFPIAEIQEYIDWKAFFHAWGIRGKFPALLDDPLTGDEANKLLNDARALLKRIADEKLYFANAAIGIYPANASGEDIYVYADESREKKICTLNMLRQQAKKAEGEPYYCLADFIASVESGKQDYIAVIACSVASDKVHIHEDDDYTNLLTKLLADRLVEAFAELLHLRIRREYWGFAKDEKLTLAELLQEKYCSIRPAPGYPAYPDHSEKRKIFSLLDVINQIGITLTENCAMQPASSICALVIAHPQARYFGLGKIQKDQLLDYARRKGLTIQEAEKWLKENLI
jgi:5-methyltetrahydrofolate--homocysteine methyltransferase